MQQEQRAWQKTFTFSRKQTPKPNNSLAAKPMAQTRRDFSQLSVLNNFFCTKLKVRKVKLLTIQKSSSVNNEHEKMAKTVS